MKSNFSASIATKKDQNCDDFKVKLTFVLLELVFNFRVIKECLAVFNSNFLLRCSQLLKGELHVGSELLLLGGVRKECHKLVSFILGCLFNLLGFFSLGAEKFALDLLLEILAVFTHVLLEKMEKKVGVEEGGEGFELRHGIHIGFCFVFSLI